MADPILKREIARLPVRRYETVRDELRSGDLVFCSGSYVFSGLIQRFTRSVWSHVGIVYRGALLAGAAGIRAMHDHPSLGCRGRVRRA